MKLKVKKPVKAFDREEAKKQAEESKQKRASKKNIGKDEYRDLIEPLELIVNDSYKLVFSVKRAGELGLPSVDIRQYSTTEVYTGFTKKGILIPLDRFIEEFQDVCNTVIDECEANGVEPEPEEQEE